MTPMNPHVALCAGMYGSGSTWCFNAVIELLRRRAGDSGEVVSFFSDSLNPAQLLAVRSAHGAAIKCHMPDMGLRAWAGSSEVLPIVTVRDPRDCVVSMMDRFNYSFVNAADSVSRSAQAALALADFPGAIVLQYEAEFLRSPATLARIANALGLSPSPAELEEIFAALTPEAVKARIKDQFPSEVPAIDAGSAYDPRTHWHPRHVGDGRSGKFAERLSGRQLWTVERENWRLMRRFGYGIQTAFAMEAGKTLAFSKNSGASWFLTEGFAPPEMWGSWLAMPRGRIDFLLARADVAEVELTLALRIGQRLLVEKGLSVVGEVNGVRRLIFSPAAWQVGASVLHTVTIAFALPAPTDCARIDLLLVDADGRVADPNLNSQRDSIGLIEATLRY